ncbi:flavodoxin family protein [Actinomarinicola tropica]|uniref:Flavodoxin n=1 Tax=Actinomarinicola tropica TaxID=2789776 RepID=A0A5Q2RGU1_9ACTN|nr:NAD(P)H-dependent oxidoreductase [Actinomarinicola tropica]QGG96049.1 flavodoxin [Actinomarinicola tropica]
MPRLLVVHHTPSPPTHTLLQAVRSGAEDDAIEGVEVVLRPALALTVPDVLDADGYLLGTPANFGYMSGALKHAFDTIYYPCLDATGGRPYALWVHGNDDTAGAVRSVETIATGLGWVRTRPALEVVGAPDREALDAAWELGAATAASLTL